MHPQHRADRNDTMEVRRQQEALGEDQDRADGRRLVRQLEGLDLEELEERELDSSGPGSYAESPSRQQLAGLAPLNCYHPDLVSAQISRHSTLVSTSLLPHHCQDGLS